MQRGIENHILRCGKLFLQYIVDQYCKVEAERLRYILLNQTKLRVENYAHLRDAINNDQNPNEVGALTILPSSFTGGPRYMVERTQDLMTYVRYYGRPHLFITFTCNPKWEEITRAIYPNQEVRYRHDIIARVFKLKVGELMRLIGKKEGGVFGKPRCHTFTIEWQKRG